MCIRDRNIIDSLYVYDNAFIIEKDTLSDNGYQQIKGGLLRGAFKESKLDNIVITKNTEMVYYLYNDEDFQLIGIDKTTCSALKMSFCDGQIDESTAIEFPEIYSFERNGASTIAYAGQIIRLMQADELYAALNYQTWLGQTIDYQALNAMFAGLDGVSAGFENPDLNGTNKIIRSKTAASSLNGSSAVKAIFDSWSIVYGLYWSCYVIIIQITISMARTIFCSF